MKPVKPLGPEVQLQAIYAAVRALAPGQVATYGGIAARAGLPGRARLVGFALRTAPDDMGLPWHRVVGAGGRIAFPSGSEAAVRQAALLRGEGVPVEGRRVDLKEPSDLDALLWGSPVAVKIRPVQRGAKR